MGDDTYLYTAGSGSETLQDGGGQDTLEFGPGIQLSNLTFLQSGNDLVIGQGSDAITLTNQLDANQPNDKIETLQFADGSTMDYTQFDALAKPPVNIIQGTSGDDLLTDTSGDDHIFGNAGNDTLISSGGHDTLEGGTGNDVYRFTPTWQSAQLVDNAGEANVLDLSAITAPLNIDLANQQVTDAAGQSIQWSGNIIQTVLGGAGDDLYIVDNSGDVIIENANEGTDTVQSSVSYTLGNNLENLTLTGTADLYGAGNSLNNVITGNSGNNTLDGGAGVDMLIGGQGNDLYIVDNTGDVITENPNEGTDTVQSSVSYTLAANVENLILTGTGNLSGTGNALDNQITGNSGNNLLGGGGGNDTYFFNNNWGLDTISDSLGENQINFSNVTSALTVNLGLTSGQALAGSNLLTWSNSAIQDVTGGSGSDNINGSSADNLLIGNAGSDILNGGGGNDTFDGGTGNDIITGGGGNDAYRFENGWGQDIVTDSGGNNTVDLTAVTANVTINFNSFFNQIASGGNTVLWSGNVANTILSGSGNDTLTGTSANEILSGGAGNDSIIGGGGGDTLIGGTGNDTLNGGTGNDTYIFNLGEGQDTVAENDSTSGNSDTALFNASIAQSHIALFRSGNNLQIGYTDNSTDQITVSNQFLSSGQIEKFQLSNGQFLTSTDINTIIQSMNSYATSHSVSFTSLNDVKNNAALLNIINTAWHS